MIIKTPEEKLLKRNRYYIDIARRNGFFTARQVNNDITTSYDWIVAYWIDELSEKNKETVVFHRIVLPSFKRWFDSGVHTLGIGTYYDFIKTLEDAGIPIDKNSVSCILAVASKYKDINQTDIEKIVEEIGKSYQQGIPVNIDLARKPMLYVIQGGLSSEKEKHL